jgi:hypothetical protein
MRISTHEYRKANDREKGNEKRDKGNGTESQERTTQRERMWRQRMKRKKESNTPK